MDEDMDPQWLAEVIDTLRGMFEIFTAECGVDPREGSMASAEDLCGKAQRLLAQREIGPIAAAPNLLQAAERGLLALESELQGLLESCCLLDRKADYAPIRATLAPEFEVDAVEIEAAIAHAKAAIAKARGE